MQTVATIVLAILAALSVGSLIVAFVVLREARRHAEARDRREATALAWSETAADDTNH